MTQSVAVANEDAFLTALGLNPKSVMKGSVRMGFDDNSTPFITYTVVQPVMPHQMGLAFLASAQQDLAEPEQPEADTEQPEKPAPTRRTPTKKTAAKKKPPQ